MELIPSPIFSPLPSMFIPRDGCSKSDSTCSNPSNAAPSDSDTTGVDPSLMEQPGPRRYIGVAMVLGIVFIVFLAWLYLGKWPRKILRQYCCCSSRSKQLPKSTDDGREDTPTPTMSSEKEGTTVEVSDRGMVKEVSGGGGVVVFTQVPKALGGKDRHPAEWEMDHVHGIRLEVCITFHLSNP